MPINFKMEGVSKLWDDESEESRSGATVSELGLNHGGNR